MNFKKQLFAKIIRENDECEKQQRAEERLVYWDKYRAENAAREQQEIAKRNLQKMVQLFVAHAKFMKIVKTIDQNIMLRNKEIQQEVMKNIIITRFQTKWKNFLAQLSNVEYEREQRRHLFKRTFCTICVATTVEDRAKTTLYDFMAAMGNLDQLRVRIH